MVYYFIKHKWQAYTNITSYKLLPSTASLLVKGNNINAHTDEEGGVVDGTPEGMGYHICTVWNDT